MAEEKKFYFWKAAKEARLIVEEWPDWKRNIQLTEYSTGLGKSVSKKEKAMTKFYNMKDCFDACGDEDFPYIDGGFNDCLLYTKKDIITEADLSKMHLSYNEIMSDKWLFRRAAHRLFMNADEIAERIEERVAPTVANGISGVRFTKIDIHEAACLGIKIGRCTRDYELMPVVEAAKKFINKRDCDEDFRTLLIYLEDAFKNIPPLEKE